VVDGPGEEDVAAAATASTLLILSSMRDCDDRVAVELGYFGCIWLVDTVEELLVAGCCCWLQVNRVHQCALASP